MTLDHLRLVLFPPILPVLSTIFSDQERYVYYTLFELISARYFGLIATALVNSAG